MEEVSSVSALSVSLCVGVFTLPRQQHEVELVSSVSFCLVQCGSLLYQMLQVARVHLQSSDQIVHVASIGLVMQVTVKKKKLGLKRTAWI